MNRELTGKEILVIGDTPLDIRCARAIGAQVLAVATGGCTLEELRAHKPDWAVKDLREALAEQII
jgi:phosphoglycolate phosphatase-like HAD superfamily hydrolase